LGAYQPGVPVELHNVSVGFEGIQVDLTGPAKPGDQFTIAPSQPDDIFASLTRAVEALKSSGASNKTYTSQELARVNVEMDDGLDRIQLARGRLGDWLNRADQMNNLFTDRTLAYQKEQSELTDVDMIKAVSEFQSNQTAYQAALQSYAQIQKMSMFDYLR
jgi:flagellar hook-associated protein 3 FlgL